MEPALGFMVFEWLAFRDGVSPLRSQPGTEPGFDDPGRRVAWWTSG